MPSMGAWQLAPEGKHDRGDGIVICTEAQNQPEPGQQRKPL
jgi:hypothetical protein